MKLYTKILSLLFFTHINILIAQDTTNTYGKETNIDTINIIDNKWEKIHQSFNSNVNASYEEIRRAPGASEDIIRYVLNLSSLSQSSDAYNEYFVRGGSPIENLITVDGIEFNNINHFSTLGSSSGAISFLNLKLVKNISFKLGGFSSLYGDKASSVLNIEYREGNSKEHTQDAYISLTGFGGFAEGPITNNSSYMFAVRRSYLEIVKDKIQSLGTAPNYWDINGKIFWKIYKTHSLNLVASGIIDKAESDNKSDISNYKNIKTNILNSGLIYKINNKNYVIGISASYSYRHYNNIFKDINYTDFSTNVKENEYSLKGTFDYKFTKTSVISVSSNVKYLYGNYFINRNPTIILGTTHRRLYVNKNTVSHKFYTALNLRQALINNKVEVDVGLRYDYFDYTMYSKTISPRFSILYKLTDKTSLSFSTGRYYQTPEMLWMISSEFNKGLKNISSIHYIVGIETKFTPEIKFSIEAYIKKYEDYAVSLFDKRYIYINSGITLYPNFLDSSISAGKGFFQGIDINIEKKVIDYGFYASLNLSFTNSRFTAIRLPTQPLEFDTEKQLILSAGYIFRNGWSFGIHFKYNGGNNYTPFELYYSYYLNEPIYDYSKYNAEKLPEYVRLDLRIEKKTKLWNIPTIFYIEIINLLNRKNLDFYDWDYINNKPRANYQLPLIPSIGINFTF